MELIRLAGIDFAYPGRPAVLKGLDFTLGAGDRVGILGPNGAGKSTMFQVAMGLRKPQAGAVMGLGQALTAERQFRPLRAAVGYLFQDPDDQLFCATVAEDVAFGPRNLGKGRDEAAHIAEQTLARVGLDGFGPRNTFQLSGGEKRLAALAAVLAMEPRAVLLDEPSTGLDAAHAARLEEVLLGSDLAWAVVSHDLEFLRRTCDRLLTLEGGRLRLAAEADPARACGRA